MLWTVVGFFQIIQETSLACLIKKRENPLTSGIEHFWVLKLEHVNFYTDEQLSKLAKIIFAVNFFMHFSHKNLLDRLSLKNTKMFDRF